MYQKVLNGAEPTKEHKATNNRKTERWKKKNTSACGHDLQTKQGQTVVGQKTKFADALNTCVMTRTKKNDGGDIA